MSTFAEQLHQAQTITLQITEIISTTFEKFEPETYDTLDFHISSDYYDNSIEIYVENVMAYPYEPCWQIRDVIYALGFSIVYWNFADSDGKYTEEIRGSEPRRYKSAAERSDPVWCAEFFAKYGIPGTDVRFDASWFDKYQRKSK